jgi:hypothetical protein
MGWLIALGVLTLIAMIPIGVSVIYNEDGPQAFVLAWPLRFLIYPMKKTKKEKEKPVKVKKTKTKAVLSQKKKKKGGSIHDFLPVVDLILDFLAAFGRKLRVNKLEMKLVLAGSDPSDLAVNYGRGWALLGNLIPLFEKAFVIKKRDIDVECDFLEDSTKISAQLDLTITVGRIVSLLTVRGIPIVRELVKLLKLSKGGAKA